MNVKSPIAGFLATVVLSYSR